MNLNVIYDTILIDNKKLSLDFIVKESTNNSWT